MRRHTVYPVPESLPGRWEITDVSDCADLHVHGIGGVTDNKNKTMAVPLGDDPTGSAIRQHEMAHATWSVSLEDPEFFKKRGLNWRGWQCVEDARIHGKAARAGFHWPEGGQLDPPEAEPLICQLIKRTLQGEDIRGQPAHQVLFAALVLTLIQRSYTLDLDRWLAMIDTSATTAPARAIAAKAIEVAARTRAMLEEQDLKPESTEPATRWLQTVLHLPPWADMVGIEGIIDGIRKRAGTDADMDSGTLVIERPSLSHFVPTDKLVARKARPGDWGLLPRFPERYCVDQRIFAQKRAATMDSGTLLIDNSGSMQLSPQALRSIVAAAPFSTVGIYSGRDTTGTLRIVASRGRHASLDVIGARYGNGNIVDYPSLKWLVKQATPRAWFTDGGVTGKGDTQTRPIVEACNRLVEEGKVTVLNGKRGVGWVIEDFKALVESARSRRR